jgi:hypothetical protein
MIVQFKNILLNKNPQPGNCGIMLQKVPESCLCSGLSQALFTEVNTAGHGAAKSYER